MKGPKPAQKQREAAKKQQEAAFFGQNCQEFPKVANFGQFFWTSLARWPVFFWPKVCLLLLLRAFGCLLLLLATFGHFFLVNEVFQGIIEDLKADAGRYGTGRGGRL